MHRCISRVLAMVNKLKFPELLEKTVVPERHVLKSSEMWLPSGPSHRFRT